MKSKLALTLAIALLSAPSPVLVVQASELTTEELEQLASHGLTLDQFNLIRNSESPSDFGGLPSQGETDQLWLDAAIFEYEAATTHADDHAAASVGYHPYVVCSKQPGLSRAERVEQVSQMFQNTPNVSASHFYMLRNLFHDYDDFSCGTIRAYNDTIAKIYAHNPEATEWMTVNPLHSSMKMAKDTVDVLDSWFNVDEENVYSIMENGKYFGVQTLELHIVLCPGVQDFEAGDVDNAQIASDVKNFVVENGGGTVEEFSFYHHRVSGMDGGDAVHTERMNQWATTVISVTNWTKDDDSNLCLDQIIGEYIQFDVKEETHLRDMLEVRSTISFTEANEVGKSLGFEANDMETCIWYLTYALGVNPMVCSLETRLGSQTLCADGTSDLKNCPSSTPPPPSDNNGGGGSNSSGRMSIGAVVWMETLLLSSLLGTMAGLDFN